MIHKLLCLIANMLLKICFNKYILKILETLDTFILIILLFKFKQKKLILFNVQFNEAILRTKVFQIIKYG